MANGHDPLCPSSGMDAEWCACALIARARIDERNNYRREHDGISDRYFCQVRADALAEARATVTALDEHDSCVGFNGPAIYQQDVLDAIDALIASARATA